MRRSKLGIIGVMALVAGSVVVALGGPAGAVTVSTEAELRDAFGDPAETSIGLANDITLLNCDDATGGDVDRDSATALILDGNGHTVRQQCEGYRVFEQAGTGALTFTNVTVENGDQIGFSEDQQGGGIRAGGDVTITRSSNIVGNLLTGQNAHGGGVFAIGDIVVSNSTISDNVAFDTGDAIDVRGAGLFTQQGDITITDSTISANEARSPLYAIGGGFWTIDGDITMTRSLLAGNLVLGADVVGGGGGTQNGTFHMTDSTVADNTANGQNGNASSGGIGARTAVVVNSTITGNVTTAQDTGGGGLDVAHLTLVYATVTSNAGEEGANISIDSDFDGTLTTFASVIAEPIDGPNCDLNGTTTASNGFNYSDDGSCGLTLGSDIPEGGNPQLGPLATNGGPTPTRVPAPGSPLLDWVVVGSCQSDGAAGITTDQRGFSRPSGPGCDIGAVEVQVQAVPVQPSFTG